MAQARLDVKVTGDASGALKAIQTVRAAGNEAATKFREQSKEAIGAIVRSLNPIVLVGTAAATAIMGIGQKISDYFEEGREAVKKAGEELQKSAEAAGVTERAYQQLRSAAERAGIAQDEFNAKMQALKEGKETVASLVEEWGKLPEKIGLTTDALERYQLEAAARRQQEEAAEEARDKNMSAVTYEDELVGEFWARVHRGEDVEAVANELIERRKGGWTGSGIKAQRLKLRLQSEWTQAEIERMDAEWSERKRREAEEEQQEAAARAASRKAQADRIKQIRENDWKEIEAAGGYEAWALAYAGMLEYGEDYSKWDVEKLRQSVAFREGIKAAQKLGRKLGRSDPDEAKRAKGADDYAKGFAAYLKEQKAAADKAEADAAKARQEAAKAEQKAAEERRKLAEEADKDAKARDALWAWYKDARIEAAQSYEGGYNNAFGLAFGGGDLIGSGRFRAVTRLTEAAKQLQVSEKLLEVNRQMNEKLKALEE